MKYCVVRSKDDGISASNILEQIKQINILLDKDRLSTTTHLGMYGCHNISVFAKRSLYMLNGPINGLYYFALAQLPSDALKLIFDTPQSDILEEYSSNSFNPECI